jgi:hypothetical protein
MPAPQDLEVQKQALRDVGIETVSFLYQARDNLSAITDALFGVEAAELVPPDEMQALLDMPIQERLQVVEAVALRLQQQSAALRGRVCG